MTVTAWNNGAHHKSGAGYGLKLSTADRDRFFQRDWDTVFLVLEERNTAVEINVNKESFWGPTCRELISREIGQWLREKGHAPWPKGRPPKFVLELLGEARFSVSAASV